MIDGMAKERIRRWWQAMNLPASELKSMNIVPANSARRAVLRRASTIDAACLTEGFRDLWLSINRDEDNTIPVDVCAAICKVLSYVTKDEKGLSIATAAGRLDTSGHVPVSEMRLSKLQSARTLDELTSRLCRLLPLVNHSVDVVILAEQIADWAYQNSSKRPIKPAHRITMRWAMEYYGANEKSVATPNGEQR